MKLLLVSFLRKRRVRLLWSLIATAFVRLLGTNGAAFLTSLGIDWGDIKPNGRTVLCISRYYFDKDIRELRARTGISFAQILGGFTRFQEPWFPTGMKRQTFYQFYDGDGKQAAIRKSRSYAGHPHGVKEAND